MSKGIETTKRHEQNDAFVSVHDSIWFEQLDWTQLPLLLDVRSFYRITRALPGCQSTEERCRIIYTF